MRRLDDVIQVFVDMGDGVQFDHYFKKSGEDDGDEMVMDAETRLREALETHLKTEDGLRGIIHSAEDEATTRWHWYLMEFEEATLWKHHLRPVEVDIVDGERSLDIDGEHISIGTKEEPRVVFGETVYLDDGETLVTDAHIEHLFTRPDVMVYADYPEWLFDLWMEWNQKRTSPESAVTDTEEKTAADHTLNPERKGFLSRLFGR